MDATAEYLAGDYRPHDRYCPRCKTIHSGVAFAARITCQSCGYEWQVESVERLHIDPRTVP